MNSRIILFTLDSELFNSFKQVNGQKDQFLANLQMYLSLYPFISLIFEFN